MESSPLDLGISVMPPVEVESSLPGPSRLGQGQSSKAVVSPTPDLPDPLPPRPTSPPLPPRNYKEGLPPSYTSHLRKLLRQWLEQQLKAGDAGLPGQRVDEPRRLWDESRLKVLEESLWQEVVVPRRGADERNGNEGLLTMNWNAWAIGAAKRKQLFKEEQAKLKAQAEVTSDAAKLGTKGKDRDKDKKLYKPPKRESTSDPELKFGSSTPATPDSRTPRPMSVASDSRDSYRETAAPEAISGAKSESDEDRELDRQVAWTALISSLPKYRPFPRHSPPVQSDGGELFPYTPCSFTQFEPAPRPHESLDVDQFPGAFPKSIRRRPPLPPPKNHIMPEATSSTTIVELTPTCALVKPVFCLHFPAPPVNASTSTLDLHRQNSTTSTLRRRSSGSNQGRWWPSASDHSSSVLSATTLTEAELTVEFKPGVFALPTTTMSRRNSKRPGRRTGDQDPASPEHLGDSPKNLSVPSVVDDSGSDSDTVPATSRLRRPQEVSLVIAGDQSDIPDQSVPDNECVLVGGTIVVRGMGGSEEQEALAQVLRVLVSVSTGWQNVH